MTAFRVLLEGRHHEILHEDELQCMGLYVTRFVEATSEVEARERAIGMVWAELQRKTVRPPNAGTILVVEECEPLPPDQEPPEVQPGIAWFPEESGEGQE